jgi:hypothetical protein
MNDKDDLQLAIFILGNVGEKSLSADDAFIEIKDYRIGIEVEVFGRAYWRGWVTCGNMLEAKIKELTHERDEADRRSGAAGMNLDDAFFGEIAARKSSSSETTTHGASHDNPQQVNVSVDVINFTPMPFEDITARFVKNIFDV